MNEKEINKRIIKFKKIINIFISILFILAVIIVASLTIQKLVIKEKVPNVFGYKILQVMSGSMSGEFKVGDTILIKSVKKEHELNVGDVITFKVSENTLVTHRIIDITKVDNTAQYTTKGDSNNTEDLEKVEFSMVEGKYVKKLNHIGNLISLMQKPYGMIITFSIPTLLIIYIINKEKNKEEKKSLRREKRLNHEIIQAKKQLGDDEVEK